MKKILLTLVAAFCCLPMLAQSVTFDFVNNDYNMTRLSGSTSEYNADGQELASVDGVTITNIKNDGNGTRLWSDGLRFYKGGLIEITSSGEEIKGVTYSPESSDDFKVYSDNGAWYLESLFNSSNKAVKTLTVWFTEPEKDPNAPSGVVSVAEVIDLIDNGYTGTAQVKGYITEIVSTQADVDQYGDINYYIADTPDGERQFYIYNGYYLGGAKFTSIDQVKVGDLVIVEGTCSVYEGVKELARGNKIISLNGETSGGNTGNNTGGEIPSEYWTVAEALQQMDNGFEGEAVVMGLVKEVKEMSTEYGNATYYIVDNMNDARSLEVFRGYGLNGSKFTSEDQLLVGATVVVSGKLVDYNGTLEFTSGSKLLYYNDENAVEPEPGDPAITGTEQAPLNVAAFLAQGTPESAIGNTYVAGYIVGFVPDKSLSEAVFGVENAANTNILIAGSRNEKNVDQVIPVQLPAGTIRDQLNLAQNPDMLGKLVTLLGSHEKYFGANGLKNVKKYWMGISEVEEVLAVDESEAVYYNLQGQKVANPDKGIYIKVVGNKAVKVVK